jgi:DNA-directed RNA polymerase specialized sigma24 family protein
LKPAGIRTDVESNDDGLAIKIEYSEADLNETETLVKKVSTYDRIMGLLKHMAYHPREISEELNIPDSTIRSTLRRAVNRGEITQLANGQYKAIEKV